MARASRLLGIVADDGALLMPVERLYGAVDADDIALTEQWPDGSLEATLQPVEASLLGDRGERPAQAVFADDPVHAKQFRQHLAGALRRDMGVVPEALFAATRLWPASAASTQAPATSRTAGAFGLVVRGGPSPAAASKRPGTFRNAAK